MSSIKRIEIVFFALAFLVLLHQYITFGVIFEPQDIHHETFALMFTSFALGIYLLRRKIVE